MGGERLKVESKGRLLSRRRTCQEEAVSELFGKQRDKRWTISNGETANTYGSGQYMQRRPRCSIDETFCDE